MTCPQCGREIPAEFQYCGNCGSRASAESLETLVLRVRNLEKNLSRKNSEKFTELELTERVASRLIRWSKIFAFLVGIPIVLWAATLALFTGRSFKSLHDVAESAKNAVVAVSNQAKSEAESARSTAQQVGAESRELGEQLQSAKQNIDNLTIQIRDRTKTLESLGTQVEKSRTNITSLENNLKEQSGQVQRLSRQVNTINTDMNEKAIARAFPVYGTSEVRTQSGGLGHPLKQNPDHVLVNIQLSAALGEAPAIDKSQMTIFLTKLKSEGYETFLGSFALLFSVGNDWSQAAAIYDRLACQSRTKSGQPPCIVYFRPDLKEKALKVASLASSAQQIDASQIVYSDPKSWGKYEYELIQKSGVDIVAVLGK